VRDLVDATELLDRLDGMPVTRAATMAGINPATLRRWRRTGLASAGLLAAAIATLDRGDPPPERQPHPTHLLDVHCTWTDSGWILDAYHHDTIVPLDAQAMLVAHGERWPTLEAAQAHARQLWGARIVAMTPEVAQ